MDAMVKFLELNGRQPGASFGGVQVVLIGDLLQLPPVVKWKNKLDKEKFDKKNGVYASRYFFGAKFLEGSKESPTPYFIELKQNRRQKDRKFRECLDSIRIAEGHTEAVETINASCHRRDNPDGSTLVLTYTRKDAARINNDKIHELAKPRQPALFQAQTGGKSRCRTTMRETKRTDTHIVPHRGS